MDVPADRLEELVFDPHACERWTHVREYMSVSSQQTELEEVTQWLQLGNRLTQEGRSTPRTIAHHMCSASIPRRPLGTLPHGRKCMLLLWASLFSFSLVEGQWKETRGGGGGERKNCFYLFFLKDAGKPGKHTSQRIPLVLVRSCGGSIALKYSFEVLILYISTFKCPETTRLLFYILLSCVLTLS